MEGVTLVLVTLLLIGISSEGGITNEAIWKPFVFSKEFATLFMRVCVCV